MKMPSFSLSRAVAGTEKLWIGVLAAFQAYAAALEWPTDPEKALIVALLGVCQMWLGTNTPTDADGDPIPPAFPDQPHNPENDTINPPKGA